MVRTHLATIVAIAVTIALAILLGLSDQGRASVAGGLTKTRPAATSIAVVGQSMDGQHELRAFTLDTVAKQLVPLFELQSNLVMNTLTNCVIGPDGSKYCSSANDTKIIVVDRGGGQKLFYSHSTCVEALAFDAGGNLYFSESTGARADGTIYRLVPQKAGPPALGIFRRVALAEIGGFWAGDFAFGLTADGEVDTNTMYLSSGNEIPASIYCSYKGDGGWSAPKRIFTSAKTSIKGLMVVNPNEAYFVDYTTVYHIRNWRTSEAVASIGDVKSMWLQAVVRQRE